MGNFLAGQEQLIEPDEKQQNWASVKVEGQLRRPRWQDLKGGLFWALVPGGIGIIPSLPLGPSSRRTPCLMSIHPFIHPSMFWGYNSEQTDKSHALMKLTLQLGEMAVNY